MLAGKLSQKSSSLAQKCQAAALCSDCRYSSTDCYVWVLVGTTLGLEGRESRSDAHVRNGGRQVWQRLWRTPNAVLLFCPGTRAPKLSLDTWSLDSLENQCGRVLPLLLSILWCKCKGWSSSSHLSPWGGPIS